MKRPLAATDRNNEPGSKKRKETERRSRDASSSSSSTRADTHLDRRDRRAERTPDKHSKEHFHRVGKARDQERLRFQDEGDNEDDMRRDRKEPGRRLAIRRENIRPQRTEEEDASKGADLKIAVREKLPKKKELKSSRREKESSPVRERKAREQERRITIHSDSSSDR